MNTVTINDLNYNAETLELQYSFLNDTMINSIHSACSEIIYVYVEHYNGNRDLYDDCLNYCFGRGIINKDIYKCLILNKHMHNMFNSILQCLMEVEQNYNNIEIPNSVMTLKL